MELYNFYVGIFTECFYSFFNFLMHPLILFLLLTYTANHFIRSIVDIYVDDEIEKNTTEKEKIEKFGEE